MVKREKAGSSFETLAKYITAKTQDANIQWVDYRNVQADDLPGAVEEIICTQRLNQTTQADKTRHLIVAFPVGEVPDRATIRDIEHELLRSIGMADHQRVSAVHADTSHLHLHVAINRIHPKHHRNIAPAFSKLKLQSAARQLEHKHALQPLIAGPPAKPIDVDRIQRAIVSTLAEPDCDWHQLQAVLADEGVCFSARGRGLVIIDETGRYVVKASSINRSLARSQLEKQLGPFVQHDLLPRPPVSPKAATMEAHAGLTSFERWARERLSDVIVSALAEPDCDWQRLQSVLADEGVRFSARGRGLVIIDETGRYVVKASSINRSLARSQLEKQLGPFVDHGVALSVCAYRPTPSVTVSQRLYADYEAIRISNMAARKKQFTAYKTQRTERLKHLTDTYKEQRRAIWNEHGLDKRRRWQLLLRLKSMKAQEEANIKAELAEIRTDIMAQTQTGRFIDYLVQKAEAGSSEGLHALRASKAVRWADKPALPGQSITGRYRTAAQIIAALPRGFRVHKNGDIVITTTDDEKVILRGQQLFVVGDSPTTRQVADTISHRLFRGVGPQMTTGVELV